ncbi:MAG TPA: hypothetical protein VIO39_00555 [Methylotenera sp.]
MSNWPIVRLILPSNIAARILMHGACAFYGMNKPPVAKTRPTSSTVCNIPQYIADRGELLTRRTFAPTI